MIMGVVELIVSVVTLIITVIISLKQLRLEEDMNEFTKDQDKRDREFRRDLVNAEAIAFIQKYNQEGYNSEIYLLPLCVIAYKYDPTYPYRRAMYRDFCSRTETVRKEILARRNMYYDCSEDKLFRKKILDSEDESLSKIMLDLVYENWHVIWGGDKHKYFDYFYKNCKYFTPALTEYGSVLRPIDNFEFENEVTDLLSESNNKGIESRRKALDEYFGWAPSIDAAYLCCLVAKYTACYYGEYDDNDKSVNLVSDYSGDLYMEDLFLDALFYVCLYQIDVNKKKHLTDDLACDTL